MTFTETLKRKPQTLKCWRADVEWATKATNVTDDSDPYYNTHTESCISEMVMGTMNDNDVDSGR